MGVCIEITMKWKGKIDNNTYGRSYTYTTDANAIWLHQSKEFSPLYPISTMC